MFWPSSISGIYGGIELGIDLGIDLGDGCYRAWRLRGPAGGSMYRIASPHGSGIYSAVGDGRVEVEHDGQRGLFDGDGVWLEGELRTVDPEMCRWVSTATGIQTRHAQSVAAMAALAPSTPQGEPA